VPHLTLDDAATLLLQLEITDTADLAKLRDALTDLAFENRVPLRAQPFVARAARVLGTIISGSATNASTAFTEVSEAIEEAMRLSDHATIDAPQPPAAERAAAPQDESAFADALDYAPMVVLESPVSTKRVAHAPSAPSATTIVVAESSVAPAPATPVRSAQHDAGTDRLPDDADFDLLPDFITESNEYVVNSEAALLNLEENPTDEEAVNTVFRAFHTVKGTSAFLGLSRIAAFAHEAESLLSRVRDKEISYTRGCADLSLRSVDMLNALLSAVVTALATDGKIPLPDGYHELLDALAAYDPALHANGVTFTPIADAVANAPSSNASVATLTGPVSTNAANAPSSAAPSSAAATAARQQRGEPNTDATIRVRTDRLDRLIDMVGELVIAQSMIAGDELFGTGKAHELLRKITHSGKIVRELQDLSMSMRMVPLRATFQKLARVVRDTAVKAGKQVQFITQGDEVEIDRTLADIVGDPLVHMVRNAVDHGVEPPSDRAAAGKTNTGTVRLSAYYASGNVVVELIDDGRGLYRDKLVKKAIEKGLIESDKGMSDSDVFALIFAPGFSTAEKITDISGRGVGMDVVRRNLESIRGRIDITSAPGKGTTFAIRLPLTLAVTDGMLVRVGQERFIIPLTHIHMSFRPEPSMLSTIVGRGEVVLLRGELMPIIRLHDLFDVADAVRSPLDGLLMIVGDGNRRTALLVDELLGQQQVVAKTLGAALGKVPGVSGGAILGDGRVGLILDVNETVALAQTDVVAPLQRDRDRTQDVAA